MSGVAPEAIALSLVLGVLLGLAFAAVEAVRALFSLGRIATAALDLLFALLAALSTFVLALAVARGSLRFFQAACEIIGFLCVELSLTHAVRRLLPRLVARLRRVSQRAGRRLKRVGKFFCGKSIHQNQKVRKSADFLGIKRKKTKKRLE